MPNVEVFDAGDETVMLSRLIVEAYSVHSAMIQDPRGEELPWNPIVLLDLDLVIIDPTSEDPVTEAKRQTARFVLEPAAAKGILDGIANSLEQLRRAASGE